VSEELIDAAALTGRYVLALVFIAAALPKIAARRDFERAVSNYDLLPASLVPVAASWLPRLEIVFSLALLIGFAVKPIAALCVVLLMGFSLAIAVNLRRGRRFSCGCFSTIAPRTIGWPLVVGDIGLAALAALVALAEPGVLTMGGSSGSALTRDDGLAALMLAAVLVLGFLLVSTLASLRSTVNARLRVEEQSA
jgi:uncharacterized membrane protein YphA (DoxX/SURF4 family)